MISSSLIPKHSRHFLAAVVLIAAAPGLLADSYTWTNPSGGSFGTGTNWSPNGIPGSGDWVLFDVSGYTGPYTVTADGNRTVDRIYSSAGESAILDLRNSGGTDYTLTSAWLMPTNGSIEIKGGSTSISLVAYVGNSGTGHVTFSEGATANFLSSDARLGGNSNSAGNSLTISGGSSVTASAFQMGTIAAVGPGVVGNNNLTVTGNLSTMTLSGILYTGGLSSNNTVSVLAGGKLTLNDSFFLGRTSNEGITPSNSKDNKLIIDGAGSSVVKGNTGVIVVGALDNPNSIRNEIVVSNNGSFTSNGATLFYDRESKIEANSGGQVVLSNTVNQIYGSIVVKEGASFSASHLQLMDSSRVSLEGGTFEIEADLSMTLAGARFSFNLEEPATVNVDGTLSLLGTTYIDITGEAAEGNYTLFTYGNATQASLDFFALGNITEGYTASLLFENDSVILSYQAIPEPQTVLLLASTLGGLALVRRRWGKSVA